MLSSVNDLIDEYFYEPGFPNSSEARDKYMKHLAQDKSDVRRVLELTKKYQMAPSGSTLKLGTLDELE